MIWKNIIKKFLKKYALYYIIDLRSGLNDLQSGFLCIINLENGNGKQSAYEFDYDAANRLLKADFTQNNGGWTTSQGVDFNMKMGDGADPKSAYDNNGNIKAMSQNGLKLNGSTLIDELNYTYPANSNKLKNVRDDNNDPASVLGDFKTLATHPQSAAKTAATTQAARDAIIDYAYDDNGNLTKDNNKGISSITYNHLNLPSIINIPIKGTITYTYDAAGM